MRLPFTVELDSRDGSDNADSRMTNVLAEQEEGGPIAQVRPGLATIATGTGNGNGINCFDGELISVFGTTLGRTESLTSVGTVQADAYDFIQSPL